MFWAGAVVDALQSNNAQANQKKMNNMQGAESERNSILQKRDQRNQIADNIGNNQSVDIDAIVASLFPKKNKSVGGFGGYGLL